MQTGIRVRQDQKPAKQKQHAAYARLTIGERHLTSTHQMILRHQLNLAALCLLFLTGCGGHVGRPHGTVKVEAPKVWQASGKGSSIGITQAWVKDFNSSQLNQLVDEAMRGNPDLATTAASVKASLESVRISRGALLPQADLGLSGSRTRIGPGDSGADGVYTNRLNNSLSVSWELDLWGRLRDQRDAAYFSYEAALADYRNARLSLAASVARAYIQLISAEQQVELSRFTVESFQKNLRIIERNYKAGVPGVRALDVQFGRSNVSSAERTLRIRLQGRDEARRALERLLGRYPAGTLKGGSTLPTVSASVPAGLPSGLIERRPDVAAARFELLASVKSANATRKALLPTLRLTASAGSSGTEWGNLLDPDFLSSAIAANLSQFISDGGRRAASARQQLAFNEASLNRFVLTALNAFREVEDRLAGESYLAQQEDFLRQEVAQASLAEEQAERDYTEGIEGSSILSLLEAQRRAFNARSSLINLKANRLLNRINLHLALGGDF